ncbi:MAG TPA: hypothetical protein VFN09_08345 [Rhodanobacteraceae bacterium]|nr:hypothetical protein [Rhodanobacteraceae bacterium]
MQEPSSQPENPPRPGAWRGISWDALAAIIASLVGFLALLVAGYTAYIERYTADIQTKQVQAQVWPYLISGNNGLTHALEVANKGVGPAIVRSVRVQVDGKPQADWGQLLSSLQLPTNHYALSILNQQVLSAGEKLQILQIPDEALWQQFLAAASGRIVLDICFCSTLDECWVSSNKNLVVTQASGLKIAVKQVAQCPRLPAADAFNN